MSKTHCVYILINQRRIVFDTGITSDLAKRIWERKQKIIRGFTCKYNVDDWVYFEVYEDVNEAIVRKKQIKNFRREKKRGLQILPGKTCRLFYQTVRMGIKESWVFSTQVLLLKFMPTTKASLGL